MSSSNARSNCRGVGERLNPGKNRIFLIDKYLNSSLEQTARSHWIKNAIIDKVNKDIIKERE